MSLIAFFDDYQTYAGQSFPELQTTAGHLTYTLRTEAPTTPIVSYSVSTTGAAGVILLPDPGVAPYLGKPGVSGVLTHLEFTPSGSISGSKITVEERVGVFAYYQQAQTASDALAKTATTTFKGSAANSTDAGYVRDALAEGNKLLGEGGFDTPSDIEAKITADADALKADGYATLAKQTLALASVAGEWNTPEYFEGTGTTLKQVTGLSIAFGINLKTINGAEATWSVKGSSGGLTVSGYTAVGSWDAGAGHGVYDVVNAETGGQLDISGQAPAPVANFPNLMSGVPSATPVRSVVLPTGQVLESWNTGEQAFNLVGDQLNSIGTARSFSTPRNNVASTILTDASIVEAWDAPAISVGNGTTPLPSIAFEVDTSGSAVYEGQAFAQSSTETGTDASVLALSNGGFVLAWYDTTQQGGAYDSAYKLEFFDSTGTPTSSALIIGSVTTSAQAPGSFYYGYHGAVALTQLENGNVVVSWTDQTSSQTNVAMHTSIYSPYGLLYPEPDELALSGTAPVSTALADGSFAVAWIGPQSGSTQPPETINIQMHDAIGTPTIGVISLSLDAGSSPTEGTKLAISTLSNGDFVVAWNKGFQLFTSRGSAIGLPSPYTLPGDVATTPSIVALANGTFEIAWQDLNAQGQAEGEYYATYDSNALTKAAALYTPPATPVSVGGALTKDTTPTFTGVATAGDTVTLYDNGKKVGSAVANKTTGAYSVTASKLADGTHELSITETSTTPKGVVTPPSSVVTVTIDSKAPVKPIVTAETLPPGSDMPTISGQAEANSTIKLYNGKIVVGTTVADGSGAYSVTSDPLTVGSHSLKVTSTDAAGNVSAASATIKVVVASNASSMIAHAPDALAAALFEGFFVHTSTLDQTTASGPRTDTMTIAAASLDLLGAQRHHA